MSANGTILVNSSEENLQASISQITDSKGVVAVLDAVGGNTATELLDCMQQGGKFVIYGGLNPGMVQFNNTTIMYKNLTITSFGILDYYNVKTAEQKADMARIVAAIIIKRDFTMPVKNIFPFQDYQQAIIEASQGSTEGKTMLVFNENK